MPEYYEDEFVIKSRDGRRKLKFNLGITNLLDYFFELFPNGKKNEIATKADIVEQIESIPLNNLSDVIITGVTNGQLLRFNGTEWVNSKYAGTNTVSTVTVGGLLSNTNISNMTLDQIIERILVPLSVPTVNLTANSTTLRNGTGTTLNWSSTSATTLTASGSWSGNKTIPAGSEATGNLTSNKTYTLTASSEGGSVSSSVTITVMPIPPAPSLLSNKLLTMSNSNYTAILSSSGVIKSNVISGTLRPMANVNDFYNGDYGTLTAFINNINKGEKILSTSSDIGVYGSLNITADEDPYNNDIYNQGWYKQLDANITPHYDLSYGVEYNYRLTHSTTGSSQDKIFYIDNPQMPIISNAMAIRLGERYISGIAFATSIRVTFSSVNTVGTFYRNGVHHQVTSPYTQNGVLTFSGINPNTTAKSIDVNVNNGVININTFTFTCSAFNSVGTETSSNFSSNILIDQNSIETDRIQSGTGLYPVIFGDTYNSIQSLNDNKELQLLDNYYRFPLSQFYPNINGDIIDGINYRWATFNVGTKLEYVNNITITIPNASIGGSVDAIKMFVKIGNSGWLDATKAQSTGMPYSNGDGALDMANTTTSVRRVTFGTQPRNGIVYVRIGIKSTDLYYFKKPTMV